MSRTIGTGRTPALLPGALRGFSLVEVTLALGLISFCLLALIALLPAGLKTSKNSREQTAAASVVEEISAAIRKSAWVAASGTYTGSGTYSNLSWTLGGKGASFDYALSLGGVPTDSAGKQRLRAHVTLFPPANAVANGNARVSVAWPQQAHWDNATAGWINAQGSLDTWIIFLPINETP